MFRTENKRILFFDSHLLYLFVNTMYIFTNKFTVLQCVFTKNKIYMETYDKPVYFTFTLNSFV